MFTPGTKSHYHHWTVNECSREFETVYLKNSPQPQPGICIADSDVTSEWASMFYYCRHKSLAWAVGSSQVQDFPPDLAYPIGGSEDEFKYFFLEIHYHNPQRLHSIIFSSTVICSIKFGNLFKFCLDLNDNSGVKLYVTQSYRKNELGILTIGTGGGWTGILMPPNANRIDLSYLCNKNCTDVKISFRFF